MKVAIHTLGCKVNLYESNVMINNFVAAGYTQVDFDDMADVYIINTCTVTNNSDRKSRKYIRQAIKQNPNAVVAAVGCYAQVAPEEVSRILGVDIVLGSKYKDKLVDIVEDHIEKKTQIIKVDSLARDKEFEQFKVETFTENTRAFVKIQDGCNYMCSYCIIPYARGRVRSKNKDVVLSEITNLVHKNFHEIVLTGINTAGYGEDLEGYSFTELLKDINKIKGDFRVRISSIEPMQITEEMLLLMSNNPNRFSKHLHIALQGGSDTLLQRMRRRYTTAEYYDKIQEVKKYIPDIALTTDMVVGFPGETQEEYDNTCEFVKKVGFYQLHVFPYSPRRKTPAANMEDQVNDLVKKIRVKNLIKISKELEIKYVHNFIDKEMKVLFQHEVAPNIWEGLSSEYIKCHLKSNENLKNKILEVNSMAVEESILICNKNV